MHTISPGNYFLYNGREVKAKELHQDNYLTVSYQDGTLLQVQEKDLRYIELGSNVLLRLRYEDNLERSVFSFLKSTKYDLHTKEDYQATIGIKKFYLTGILYDDKSIWQFSNLITLHYLHQLQNLIAILDPVLSVIIP